uniref:FAR1 domain-containing protein n=1 Tax=Rhabditophanes sp. KR3021 TaxID=114890 RepID=A0AC35U0G5_9BILA
MLNNTTGESNGPLWESFMALAATVMKENNDLRSLSSTPSIDSSGVSSMDSDGFSMDSNSSTSPLPQENLDLNSISVNQFNGQLSNLFRPVPLKVSQQETISNKKTNALEEMKEELVVETIEKKESKKCRKSNIGPSLGIRPKSRSDSTIPALDASQFDVIEVGAKFRTFRDFNRVFEAWKEENFHPFRVASSENLHDPDQAVVDRFEYRYIVFHCAHYGMPRKRGIGKRPNQVYLPCGCHAMLRLNYHYMDDVLRITSLNLDHKGHSVSFENFNKVRSNRKKAYGSKDTTRVKPVERKIKQQKTAAPSENVSLNDSVNLNDQPHNLINFLSKTPISNQSTSFFTLNQQIAILQNFSALQRNMNPFLPQFMVPQQFGMQWPFNNFIQQHNSNPLASLVKDQKPPI